MSKKRKGRPPGPEPTHPVQIRVPESVLDALEQLAKANRRTRNQEIMLAIEDRLRAAELWPGDDEDE